MSLEHWRHTPEPKPDYPKHLEKVLRPEHIRYLLGWNALINTEGRDFSLLYPCSGPDILTPFLAFNPTKMTAIDGLKMRAHELVEDVQPERWPIIDTETPALPLRFTTGMAAGHPTKLIDEALEFRRTYGHFHTSRIEHIGLDRLVAVELKRMGVDPKTIHISSYQENDHPVVQITFEWQHPKEDRPKLRTVQYHKMFFGKLRAGLPQLRKHLSEPTDPLLAEGYDGYYQKASQFAWLFNPDQEELRRAITDRMHPNGTILTTVVPGPEPTHKEDRLMRKQNLQIVPRMPNFEPLSLPLGLTKAMVAAETHAEYGWHLVGMQKKGTS